MKIIGLITLETNSKHILTASYFRIGIEFIDVEQNKFKEWIKKYFKRHKDDFEILRELIYEKIIESMYVKIIFYFKDLDKKELRYLYFLFPVELFDNEKEIEKLNDSVNTFVDRLKIIGISPKIEEVKNLYEKELKIFEGLKC